jgi:hypothetical protein
MKNLTVQKDLICMTKAEFERLQKHLLDVEAQRDEANRLYSLSYQEKIDVLRGAEVIQEKAKHFEERCEELAGKLSVIKYRAASVKGNYKHPDELETAVFKAFEEISKVVDE